MHFLFILLYAIPFVSRFLYPLGLSSLNLMMMKFSCFMQAGPSSLGLFQFSLIWRLAVTPVYCPCQALFPATRLGVSILDQGTLSIAWKPLNLLLSQTTEEKKPSAPPFEFLIAPIPKLHWNEGMFTSISPFYTAFENSFLLVLLLYDPNKGSSGTIFSFSFSTFSWFRLWISGSWHDIHPSKRLCPTQGNSSPFTYLHVPSQWLISLIGWFKRFFSLAIINTMYIFF